MKTFIAQHNDGKTANTTTIEVNLASSGLTYRVENDPKVVRWSFESIKSVGPVVAGEVVQIGCDDYPGELIFSDDPEFAKTLLELVPSLSARAETYRVLKPVLAIAAVIFFGIAAIWYFDLSVSRSIAQLMPDELRKGLGKQVAASLTRGRKQCDGRKGLDALKIVVNRLKKGTPVKRDFDVVVAQLGIVNAFAAPGEKIVISDELVSFVRSPEELAGVIAHEMGHGIKMHPETGIVRALGISAGLQLVLGGGAGQLGEIGGFLLQLRYTRDAEREADTVALEILRRAEVRPKAFSDFFRRLENRFADKSKKKDVGRPSSQSTSGRLSDLRNILSTHPPLPERAKRILEIERWASRPLLSATEWESLRRICE